MGGSSILLIFTLLIAIVILATALKIADESERFAVFLLGRFQFFQGPGLVLIMPFTQRAHRLKVGDVGTLVSDEFARFGDVDIPVGNTGSLRQGQAVRIDGFDGVEPRIVASATPAKTMCPKCGHQF